MYEADDYDGDAEKRRVRLEEVRRKRLHNTIEWMSWMSSAASSQASSKESSSSECSTHVELPDDAAVAGKRRRAM